MIVSVKRRLVHIAPLAAVCLCLMAAGACSREPPLQAAVLALSGSMLGRLEPCGCSENETGGLPRRHSYLRELARRFESVLLVDNGDLVDGASARHQIKMAFAAAALDEMGYAVVNVGQRDLAFGVDFLNGLAAGLAGLQFVSANFRPRDSATVAQGAEWPCKTHVVREVEVAGRRYRVGIVGLMSDRFGPALAKLAPQGRVLPAQDALRGLMPRLEAESDFVILLAQMPANEAVRLAESVTGLDVVICGHGHNIPEELRPDASAPCRPRVFDSGDMGRWIGTLTLASDSSGALAGSDFSIEIIDHSFPPSQHMEQLILDYRTVLRDEGLLARMAQGAGRPKGAAYVGSEACGACHERDLAIWRRTRHAHAYRTLRRLREHKEYDPECVDCHVVGLGYATGFASVAQTPQLANVGCEACHGAGLQHVEHPTRPYDKSSANFCRDRCHNSDHSTDFKFERDWPPVKHGTQKVGRRKTSH